MTDVLIRFDVDHLSYVEEPSFRRDLDDRLTGEERFCNTAIRVPEDRLEEVRPAFERWEIPIELYRIAAVDHRETDVQTFVEYCDSDFGAAVMDREAAYVDDHLGSADRVLDVGAGVGAIEDRLDRDVVGLDASVPMLEEARRRTDNLYVHGEATDLPFPPDSFDAVIGVSTLEFVEDYRAAIDEAHRVLRPPGRLVALFLNPESRYVKRHLEEEDSYYHRIRHDPEDVVDYAATGFDLDTEYFLGIDGTDVYASDDPEDAAIYAAVGRAVRDG